LILRDSRAAPPAAMLASAMGDPPAINHLPSLTQLSLYAAGGASKSGWANSPLPLRQA
jgi:hypothetical protein